MADVELTLEEAQGGDLPLVCMVCGEAAHIIRNRGLSWRRKLRLRAPLCLVHKNHWFWRDLFTWTGFVVSVAVTASGSLVISFVPDTASFRAFNVGGLVIFIGLVMFFFAIVVALICWFSGIHTRRIGERGVVLTDVASEFVEAVRVQRERKASGSLEGKP